MNLHKHKDAFEALIAIVADYIGIPSDAVRRDYYIVLLMQNLQNSDMPTHVYLSVEPLSANATQVQSVVFRKILI